MSDEQLQQSEAPVESQETASAPTEQPSFEDIAKKYSIEEQTASFTAQPAPQFQPAQSQPQPTPQPYQPQIPDPVVNPDAWAQFHAQQNQQFNSTLKTIADSVQEMRRQQAQERLNADVDQAVTRVNQKLNMDKDHTEVLLEVEYRKNPVFRRIWDNRHAKPEALNEALDVLASKTASKFQVRSDPQLIENQRAAKTSQKAMASTRQQAPGEDIMNMPDGDFQAWWNRNRGF